MKRAALIVAVLAVVVGAVWYWRDHARETAPPNARAIPAAGSSSAPVGSASGAAPGKPPAKVTQVSRDQRDQMARQIAAAQAARGAHSAPPRPSLPAGSDDSPHDLDHVESNVRTALEQAIPFLAACYKEHPPANPTLNGVAQMTLTGDPDIGTVIDADQIYDDHHQPIGKELDDCLRSTMQTLELPPLAEGDSVRIQYSFSFKDK